MNGLEKISKLFGKPKPAVRGITTLFLKDKLERLSDEQLSRAMQRGWRTRNFYGISIFDGQGGLLKMNAMFFPMQHFERRSDSTLLGEAEMPIWAYHHAYTSFGYACPGGIPVGSIRDQFYGLLGFFCAELLHENTKALLFVEDHTVLRYDTRLIERLRSGQNWNPTQLSTEQS